MLMFLVHVNISAPALRVAVAQGAMFVVTTTSDAPDATPGDGACASTIPGGACTLRAAIEEANQQTNGATILLAGGRDPLTYTLASGSSALVIQRSLTLQSPTGAGLRVVDGSGLAPNNPLFDVLTGTVVIAGVTIYGAPLGGIVNRSSASLILSNSALIGNRNAGLLNDGGVVRVVNSTFSGNSGSGLYNQVNGQMYLGNVTVVSNTATVGGGLFNNRGTVTVTNSLIAGNSATSSAPDCYGSFVSAGYNLIGNLDDCTGFENNDLVGFAPRVGPLRDNGGPALTHALWSDSRAIDAGSPDGCRDHANVLLTTDARGVWRPQGARCDIGAFEMAYASLTQAAFTVSDAAATAVISATVANRVPFGLTVDYSTSGGTARPGVDYTEASGSFTLSSIPVTFTIPITGSPLYTGDLTFNVALSVPPGAGLGTPSAATVTIVDSQPPPQTQFASGTYTALRSAGAVTALVTLNTVSGVTATVNYATVNGTALAGVDFAPTNGTLVFPPGQTTRPVTITLLNPGFYTGDKTFSLALSQPVSATLGAPASATIELVDDNPRRMYLPIVARGPEFYSSPCETEPNNLVSQANGPLQSGRPVCGNYNGADARDDDYFYFESRHSGPIQVKVDNAISGLQVQLFYQSTSNFVGFSAGPPFTILYSTGAPGRYYARVVMPSGYVGGTYSLTVTYP
ncbi:MAG: CSLREA domain-containing protein [Anaerolineales bacterium]|nr:CSLREA domain-containing protein [Anaerolineales bacterium]